MGKKRRHIVQHNNKIGYWAGSGERREFYPLTNFGVSILKFVEGPSEQPDYKGFIVEVTQEQRGRTLKG